MIFIRTLSGAIHARRYAAIMQPPAQLRPSPTSKSFAGLLASLTTSEHDAPSDDTVWASGELGEGVALLSYEQALRAHALDRPNDRNHWPPVETAGTGAALHEAESSPAEELWEQASTLPAVSADRDLRSASVTIRVSQAECARLRRRAAEAGLTVSAYLRSCALEAEALRAQVKHALAELKAGSEAARQQGSKAAGNLRGTDSNPPAKNAVMLHRVLGHIGKLWVGFSAGNCA